MVPGSGPPGCLLHDGARVLEMNGTPRVPRAMLQTQIPPLRGLCPTVMQAEHPGITSRRRAWWLGHFLSPMRRLALTMGRFAAMTKSAMQKTYRHAAQPDHGRTGRGADTVMTHLQQRQVAQFLPDFGFLHWANACPGSLDRLWALNPQSPRPAAEDAIAPTQPMDFSGL